MDLHQSDASLLDTAIVSSAAEVLGSDLPPGQFRSTLGRTPGYFSTANDGAANYTVPLWVPDGRAGMQPSLTLSYSSTSSNGPLGVGFNLGGLSQIARCPRIIDRDGVSLAIQFDDALASSMPGVPGVYHGDLLCLDGDPLVPVRDDGRHVVEFRTLHETFSQILVDGYDAMGPTSFTIRAKSGQVYRYGNRPESRLESLRVRLATTDDGTVPIPNPFFNPSKPETPEDGPNPRNKGTTTRSIVTPSYDQSVRFSWAISDAADRSGNTITYDYRITSTSVADVCSTPSPGCAAQGVQLLPTLIQYTGSTNLPATRQVRFVWSPRPDITSKWVSGLKLAEGARLSEVAMFGPDPVETKQLRSYLLAYEQSPVSARSRLTTLTECDGASICKLPTNFGWTNDSVAREVKTVSTEPELDDPRNARIGNLDDLFFNDLQFDPSGQTLVLDIDGDGYDDVLYRTRRDPVLDAGQVPSTKPVRRIAKYYYRLSTHTGLGPRVEAGIAPVDSTSDRIDTCVHSGILTGVPGSFEWNQSYFASCMPPMPRPIDVDMNGIPELHDGLSLYKWDATFRRYVAYAPADDPTNGVAKDLARTHFFVADLTGDMLPELVSIFEAAPSYFFNYGGTFVGAPVTRPVPWPGVILSPGRTMVGSFTGDGRTTLLAQRFGLKRYLRLTVGGSPTPADSIAQQSELAAPLGDPGALSYRFADLNDDGLDDALAAGFPLTRDVATGEYQVWTNTGAGFLPDTIIPRSSGSMDSLWDDTQDGIAELHDGWQTVTDVATHAAPPTLAPDKETFSPLAILDVNGDGIADILYQQQAFGFALAVSKHPTTRADLLTSIEERGTLSVGYQLQTGTGTASICPHVAVQCLEHARWTLASVQRTSGAGTVLERSTYAWANPVTMAAGVALGFVGYGQRSTVDALTGSTTVTHFDATTGAVSIFGYVGVVTDETTTSPIGDGRTLTSSVTYHREVGPGSLTTTAVAHQPSTLRTRSVEEILVESSPSPHELRHRTTAYGYDAWGNVTSEIATAHHANIAIRTTRRFDDDPTNWFLGQLRRVDVLARDATSGETVSRAIEFSYDGLGRLREQISAPDGGPEVRLITTFGYSPGGQISDVIRRAAGEVRLAKSVRFDDREQMWPVEVSDALGHVSGFTIHPGLGVVVAAIDPNGVTVTRRYDGFGRLRETHMPDGNSETRVFAFGSAGETVVRIKDAFGRTISLRSDDVGRPLEATDDVLDEGNRSKTWSYGDAVHPWSATLVQRPHFVSDSGFGDVLTFDRLGRVTRITHPDGTFGKASYSGLTVTSTDEVGNERTVQHDELGRTLSSTQYPTPATISPGGHPIRHPVTTHYQYSPLGQLRFVTDALGNHSVHVYDELGRPVRSHDPDRGDEQTIYDAFGDVVSAVDGLGRRNTFEIDALGRMQGVDNVDGVTCFAWDDAPHGVGKLSSARLDDVKTEWHYDALGRTVSQAWTIEGERFELGTEYAALGLVRSMTYPKAAGSEPLTAIFDHAASGLLGSVSLLDPAAGTIQPIWSVRQRDARGRARLERLGRDDVGLLRATSFEPTRDRLQVIETGFGTSAADLHGRVQSTSYQYFDDGEISSRVDGVNATFDRFLYDGVDELAQWETGNGIVPTASASTTTKYTYDAIGNLSARTEAKIGSGPPHVETFGVGEGSAGPHAVTSSSSGEHFTYDSAGQQVTAPGRVVTAYTATSLPKDVTTTSGDAHFVYDAFGTRTVQHTSSGLVVTTLGPYERRVAEGVTTHIFTLPGGAQMIWTQRDGALVKKRIRSTNRVRSTERLSIRGRA